MKKQQKRKLPFYIFLCYLISYNSGMQMSGQQHILLDMRTEFGISNATMALISSVQMLTSLGLSLLFSRIIDRIANKKLVLTGGSIAVCGALLNGFSTGPATTILAFMISSVGSCFLMAVPYSAFSQLDPDNVTKHVNVQQGVLSFGAVISPLLLAVLIGRLGLNWRWHYRISASILTIIITLFAQTKTGVPQSYRETHEIGGGKDTPSTRKRLIFTPAFLLLSATLGIYMATEVGILNYSKEYFMVRLDDVVGASLCISLIRASMTVTRLTASRIIKNRVTLCVGSFALSGISLLLMAVFPIKVFSLLWCVLFGLFAGPCWPTVFSIGLDLDLKASGKLSSTMMIFNNIGTNLGNLTIGAAADRFGVQSSFYVTAGAALLGTIVFPLAVKFFRKSGKAPEGKTWKIWKKEQKALRQEMTG